MTSRLLLLLFFAASAQAQSLLIEGKPAQLDVRPAGEHGIRVTFKPVSFPADFPSTPALSDVKYQRPALSLRKRKSVNKKIGSLQIEVTPEPLSLIVTRSNGRQVQKIIFQEDGTLSFPLSDKPVLGMGEGGPKPDKDVDWRSLPIEFDRRGRLHKMQPRWQGDAYGSRNPVPLLIGTEGWGLFVASPWVQVNLTQKDKGVFIPVKPISSGPQTEHNQNQNLGKGLPPPSNFVSGLFDIFIFDAADPKQFMKDISVISGPAVLPPKWSLGYMQSHRTLQDENQILGIVDTFREKRIPVDAVIYLGTGFCPRGWNTTQPSFDFNPEVFKRDPKTVLGDFHSKNVKVIVHIVPWDRDKLPNLQGNIPPLPGELMDPSHIQTYWQQHVTLVNSGIDAFWPDEGDWFDLFERIKRHQLYYQGPISTQPGVRPWSLHRNGYLGIAKWGGWVWSGDTESSWKTLEGQVAVGINHSLSLSPYWGSDIGGFYPNPEKTGELYARWFQFGAFCPSFRSHGRTWQTSLPWGWGLPTMGVQEGNNDNSNNPYRMNPSPSSMNDPTVEPVCKKYDELRYQLLPYNYSLTWEARTSGLPLMRALWLHYPDDPVAQGLGSEYLWGRDLLIAPVFTKGATSRNVYLPGGEWYDWWSLKKEKGNQTVNRQVDLSIMPIYVRAGAIIPFDPVRQFTSQKVQDPTTLKIFTGANGSFSWYDDDGMTLKYLEGGQTIDIAWDDAGKKLTIGGSKKADPRKLRIELLPQGTVREIQYSGQPATITF